MSRHPETPTPYVHDLEKEIRLWDLILERVRLVHGAAQILATQTTPAWAVADPDLAMTLKNAALRPAEVANSLNSPDSVATLTHVLGAEEWPPFPPLVQLVEKLPQETVTQKLIAQNFLSLTSRDLEFLKMAYNHKYGRKYPLKGHINDENRFGKDYLFGFLNPEDDRFKPYRDLLLDGMDQLDPRIKYLVRKHGYTISSQKSSIHTSTADWTRVEFTAKF